MQHDITLSLLASLELNISMYIALNCWLTCDYNSFNNLSKLQYCSF